MDNQLEKKLNQLQDLLRTQIKAHEDLLGILVCKRQALQQADMAMMNDCTLRESRLVAAIGETEKQRLAMLGDITLSIDAQASQPWTMLQLAEKLPEPMRGKLLVLRLELRQRIEHVQKETGVARRASETLLKHVHGIVQLIGTACSGVSTYSHKGGHHQKTTAVSTFNMTA